MNRIDEHMVGIWQITTMPLRARLSRGHVIIERSGTGKQVSSIPESIFLALEPIEVVGIIDKDLSKEIGESVSILRTDFSGHNKNPFSSQN